MRAIDNLSEKAKRFANDLLIKSSSEELDQLQQAGTPDQAELEAWGITADEWNHAVQAAITDRMDGVNDHQ